MEAVTQIRDFFVCIGAQKAGTTWLARTLSLHPDLFLTPIKEIHYFDHVHNNTDDLSDRYRYSRRRKYRQKLFTQLHRFRPLHRQWSWYRAYMRTPIDDHWYTGLFLDRMGKRFAGEVTPHYAIIGQQGFEHLRRLAPQVRVLFILRNPVMRAWSQLLHYCRATDRNVTDLSMPELIALTEEAPNFKALGDYVTTIAELKQTFPADQILFLFYEDIHSDRANALRQVCAFIGIPFDAGNFPAISRRFNQSQNAPFPEEFRRFLQHMYHGQAIDVANSIGRIPKNWRQEFFL